MSPARDPAREMPRPEAAHEARDRRAAGGRWADVVERRWAVGGLHEAVHEEQAAGREAERARRAAEAAELGRAREAVAIRSAGYAIAMTLPVREIRAEYARLRARAESGRAFDARAGEMAGERPTPGMWLAAARRIDAERRVR